jgi:putative membrane protein
MNTQPLRIQHKAARLALLVVTASALTAFAADQTSTTVGGTAARDRNDTVRSNETRINTAGTGMVESSKLTRGDRRFLEKAADRGLKELRVAQLAAEKSGDPRVRSFAQELVSDHEKANGELSALAARKGVALDQHDQSDRHYNKLADKAGADFDKGFVDHMLDDHDDDIEMYEKAARKSDDADVAAFASKQLPILQKHKSTTLELERSFKK